MLILIGISILVKLGQSIESQIVEVYPDKLHILADNPRLGDFDSFDDLAPEAC